VRLGSHGPDTRPIAGGKAANSKGVAIELTRTQVDEIVRRTGEAGGLSLLYSCARDPSWRSDVADSHYLQDHRLSRSLLNGLFVLACLPDDGGELGIVELAEMIDMKTSTAHRYAMTLVAAGLLERNPDSRKYRLVVK
jgi:hypothetical protein